MKAIKPAVVGIFSAAALCLAATAVSAQETQVYDWPSDDAPVLVQAEGGLVLIGNDGAPMRAFSWRQNDGERDSAIRLTDMDGNGSPNIVGSGTPSFVLEANGEPTFSFEQGCRQVLIASITGTRGQDLVCVKNDEVRAYTGDGQFAWSLKPGRNLDWCRAGDISGNSRDDVECKYRGRGNQFLRIGADGSVMAQSSEEELLEEARESITLFGAVSESVWTGQESYDLNGNGSASETLHVVDDALEVRTSGAEEPLFRVETSGEPKAALVKDLDGEGALSIIAVTDNRIYVIKDGGEEVQDFSADARRYNRVPYADLVSVYARGFGENDSEARKGVEAIQDKISQCYGARLRSNAYAGSGRQMLQVSVSEDGSVENVTQTASQVGDRQVESCARQALEGAEYPAAAEGESGSVNVNIVFTFRDEER